MSGDDIQIRQAPNRKIGTYPASETHTSSLGGMDEELKAMKEIALILINLDPSARERTIRWVSDHMLPVSDG